MSPAAPVVAVAARTALDEFGTKGEFKRTDAVWRNWIGEGQCVSSGSVMAPGLIRRTAALVSFVRLLD
jgi:hypothetical protein